MNFPPASTFTAMVRTRRPLRFRTSTITEPWFVDAMTPPIRRGATPRVLPTSWPLVRVLVVRIGAAGGAGTVVTVVVVVGAGLAAGGWTRPGTVVVTFATGEFGCVTSPPEAAGIVVLGDAPPPPLTATVVVVVAVIPVMLYGLDAVVVDGPVLPARSAPAPY